MKIIEISVAIFVIYILLWAAIGAKTQADCLNQGYPKSDVTYKFDGYCMNLSGSITVRVDKQ